jgi:peptidoglycan/LPS O-acetylase OafA/YrhL
MTTAMLVVSSRSPHNVLSRAFSWKPLVFIGTFSYSLYLIHAPVLQLLWQYLISPSSAEPSAKFGFLMTLGLLIVLGAAYGFFRVFEEPFMRPGGRPRGRSVEAAMPAA